MSIPEIETKRDAQRYSDMLTEQERQDMAEWAELQPVEHICFAINSVQKLTDKQLKRLITVLSNKAASSGCHMMAVAGLDDAGDIL